MYSKLVYTVTSSVKFCLLIDSVKTSLKKKKRLKQKFFLGFHLLFNNKLCLCKRHQHQEYKGCKNFYKQHSICSDTAIYLSISSTQVSSALKMQNRNCINY